MSSTTQTTSNCTDNDDTDGFTPPTIINTSAFLLDDDSTPPDYSAATPKSEHIDPTSTDAMKRFYLRLFLNDAISATEDEPLISVMELMLNGRTVAEASRELNRPRMTVHDQHQKGLAILKSYLESNPELLELYRLSD